MSDLKKKFTICFILLSAMQVRKQGGLHPGHLILTIVFTIWTPRYYDEIINIFLISHFV